MRNANHHHRSLEPRSATATEEVATHVLDESAAPRESSSSPKAVPHFTPAERTGRGKAARGELPRSAHAGWEPGPRRTDPVDLLEEHADPSARARPDPVRAHARVAVHLLPRRRVSDGGRSRRPRVKSMP
jgi:hypothetical protein